MNDEPLYRKTVNILVNSYMNDTLAHGDCKACAVGNLVCANMGYGEVLYIEEGKILWQSVFVTMTDGDNGIQFQNLAPNFYLGIAKAEIDSTGYSWQNLAKIEYAFETAPKGDSDDEWMFNGLMAVIDVLDEIHENKNELTTIGSKARFHKATVSAIY